MMMTALTSTVRDLPDALPDVLPDDGRFVERLAGRRLVVFLDYDGVLTRMRDTVRAPAQRCTVCVVSGRDRAVVEELMGVNDLVVAGSRGFDIGSPNGGEIQHGAASGFSDVVEATYRLRAEVGSVTCRPAAVSVSAGSLPRPRPRGNRVSSATAPTSSPPPPTPSSPARTSTP